MRKYNTIFIDIDNTLYNHVNLEYPASAIKGLKEAHRKGIKIVLSTGRSLDLIHEIGPEKVIPVDAFIASNGYMVFDKDERLIFDYAFNPQDLKFILDVCRQHQIGLQYINDNTNFVNVPLNEHIVKACDAFQIPYPEYKEYEGERVCQLLLFASAGEQELIEPLMGEYQLHRFHEYAVDVFDKKNNKGTAVIKYMKMFNIKPEEAIAFGDANNDFEMLRAVKYSVAMGNATPELKSIAWYTTTKVNEDGVYNALVHLGIVKEGSK